MKESSNHYRKLIESIKLLSLPYQEQKDYFPAFVDIPFEVLDSFENAFLLLPALIENGQFSNLAIASIIRLHNFINTTVHNPYLKELEENDFSNNSEWNTVRELSKITLTLLNEPIEKPNLDYL